MKSIDELRYALAKQVRDDCHELTINTNYGELRLLDGAARRVAKAIRRELEAQLRRQLRRETR